LIREKSPSTINNYAKHLEGIFLEERLQEKKEINNVILYFPSGLKDYFVFVQTNKIICIENKTKK